MKPILVMIRGIPGSGKSYIATMLRDRIGGGVTILDPDSIDKASDAYVSFSESLLADGIEEKFHPYRFLRMQGYDGISAGHVVIWNQAFIDRKGFDITVDRMREYAADNNIPLPVVVVEVEVSKETARRRTSERAAAGGHAVPDEKLDEFVSNYHTFAETGYDVIAVSGEGNIEESCESIVHLIDEKRQLRP